MNELLQETKRTNRFVRFQIIFTKSSGYEYRNLLLSTFEYNTVSEGVEIRLVTKCDPVVYGYEDLIDFDNGTVLHGKMRQDASLDKHYYAQFGRLICTHGSIREILSDVVLDEGAFIDIRPCEEHGLYAGKASEFLMWINPKISEI